MCQNRIIFKIENFTPSISQCVQYDNGYKKNLQLVLFYTYPKI